ncbi:MAG TPA: hypothetical protein VHA73_11785 [Acidimicrobiales bacterium]|jgi:hypothetical protein|nr:hypothetical protein [Acidimicrobiales bacterium]
MEIERLGSPDAEFLPGHCAADDDCDRVMADCADDCARRGHEWSSVDPGLCVHCGRWWAPAHRRAVAA